MDIRLIIAFAFFALLPAIATAEQRVIVLDDGSRILGEVVGMRGDSWLIETTSLGTVEVDADRIRSMASASPSTPSADAASGSASALKTIESTIASDPGLMARIMNLQNDPEVQAVLTDPEIMAAVRSFDLEALRSNPKFQALMNDKEIRAITSGLR